MPMYGHKIASFMMAHVISEDATLSGGRFVVAIAAALVQHKVPTNTISIKFKHGTTVPLTIEIAESNVKATQKRCKKDTKVHLTESLFILSIL